MAIGTDAGHATQSAQDVSTQTAFAIIAGVAALFVALVVLVFYFMRDKTMSKEILDVQRRFDAFKVWDKVTLTECACTKSKRC